MGPIRTAAEPPSLMDAVHRKIGWESSGVPLYRILDD
jgi:hypothetical protein